MLRHQRYQNNPQTQHPRTHKKSNSNSTQDDLQKSIDAKSNKLKSQLCKKFMEKGYCPYDKRCKFAHGLNELRKNNQVNSKYKTKECGSFKNHQFCIYGDRCNFIHVKGTEWREESKKEADAFGADVEMKLIKTVAQKQSRLLSKLF